MSTSTCIPHSNLSPAPFEEQAISCDRQYQPQGKTLLTWRTFPIILGAKDNGSAISTEVTVSMRIQSEIMVKELFSSSCSAVSDDWFAWFYINSLYPSVQTSCQTSKLQQARIRSLQTAPSMTSPIDKSLHSPDPQHWGSLQALRMKNNSTDNWGWRTMWRAKK